MMPTATTPLGRAVLALRNAQDFSDQLSAFLAKRADAGRHVNQLASGITTELALLEASLLAAQPNLTGQIEINGNVTITGTLATSNLWLDLGDGVTR